MQLPIIGSPDTIPLNNIICLGRNYRKHAEELNNPVPSKPVVFLKPNSSAIGDGENIIIPPGIGAVHHEVELAVVIGEGGSHISERSAMSHVLGYAVMLDLTARDVQSGLKEKGLPWLLAKGVDTFAPIGKVRLAGELEAAGLDPGALDIRLDVNGVRRQDSNTRMMMFSIAYQIHFISSFMTLQRGDVIATGTPEGVGPLAVGDETLAVIDGVGELRNTVVSG